MIKSRRESGLGPANPISILTGVTFHLSVPLQGARKPDAAPSRAWVPGYPASALKQHGQTASTLTARTLLTGPEERAPGFHCSVL